ncbi:restriction endonuclease subunit S [Streptomyces sp. NPDC050509]|uniref:restriction endonuclease subunit S n=1 Tax=Streptomyces sp. NPDC050509 TaxID=3365620 RepID=UPI0037963396
MSVDSGEEGLGTPGSSGATRLPAGWAWVKLADILIAPTSNGRSVRSDDDGFPVLRLTALKDDGVDLREYKLGDWTVEEAAPYLIRPGDFLVSRASGSLSLVGRGALVTSVMEPVAYPDTMIRIRTSPEHIEPRFLAHLWASPTVRRQIERSARTGTGINKVSQSAIREVALPLPPTAEQRRIADALDERLARLNQIEARLGAAQLRLKSLHEEVLATAFGTTEDSIASLRDVLQEPLTNGKSVPTSEGDDGFPVLRLTALTASVVDLSQHKHGEWSAQDAKPFVVREGDFLVCRGNGSLPLVGRGALVPEVHAPVAFPDTMIRIRADCERVLPRYLHYVWASPSARKQIERGARTGTGIYKVNQKLLDEIQLPFPSLDVQRKIVDDIDRALIHVGACATGVSDALMHATALRHALLSQAFAGHLVAQDPDDEPAEDLLKRIRAGREAADAERKAARRAASQAKRKSQAKPKAPAPADVPPPSASTTDAPLSEGEQATLSLEFNA